MAEGLFQLRSETMLARSVFSRLPESPVMRTVLPDFLSRSLVSWIPSEIGKVPLA